MADYVRHSSSFQDAKPRGSADIGPSSMTVSEKDMEIILHLRAKGKERDLLLSASGSNTLRAWVMAFEAARDQVHRISLCS